jgi:hypothetical protein
MGRLSGGSAGDLARIDKGARATYFKDRARPLARARFRARLSLIVEPIERLTGSTEQRRNAFDASADRRRRSDYRDIARSCA